MRSFGQYCGLARSLEIIGDRWNLLIVRELLIGPARYRDLQGGLPGIATNMLTDRLRDLEAAGVVERTVGDEGSVVQYKLTEWGAQLREPISGLLRWSVPLMVSGPAQDDAFKPDWLMLAIPALLERRAPKDVSTSIAIDVREAVFELHVEPSGVSMVPVGESLPGTIIRAEPYVILALAAGGFTVDDAVNLGLIEVEGDQEAARRAFTT